MMPRMYRDDMHLMGVYRFLPPAAMLPLNVIIERIDAYFLTRTADVATSGCIPCCCEWRCVYMKAGVHFGFDVRLYHQAAAAAAAGAGWVIEVQRIEGDYVVTFFDIRNDIFALFPESVAPAKPPSFQFPQRRFVSTTPPEKKNMQTTNLQLFLPPVETIREAIARDPYFGAKYAASYYSLPRAAAAAEEEENIVALMDLVCNEDMFSWSQQHALLALADAEETTTTRFDQMPRWAEILHILQFYDRAGYATRITREKCAKFMAFF